MSELKLDAIVEVENFGSIVARTGFRGQQEAVDNDDIVDLIDRLQAELDKCRVKWTGEVPTKEGWYWMRWTDGESPAVDILQVELVDGRFRYGDRTDKGVKLSEFAGPLAPPEEKE